MCARVKDLGIPGQMDVRNWLRSNSVRKFLLFSWAFLLPKIIPSNFKILDGEDGQTGWGTFFEWRRNHLEALVPDAECPLSFLILAILDADNLLQHVKMVNPGPSEDLDASKGEIIKSLKEMPARAAEIGIAEELRATLDGIGADALPIRVAETAAIGMEHGLVHFMEECMRVDGQKLSFPETLRRGVSPKEFEKLWVAAFCGPCTWANRITDTVHYICGELDFDEWVRKNTMAFDDCYGRLIDTVTQLEHQEEIKAVSLSSDFQEAAFVSLSPEEIKQSTDDGNSIGSQAKWLEELLVEVDGRLRLTLARRSAPSIYYDGMHWPRADVEFRLLCRGSADVRQATNQLVADGLETVGWLLGGMLWKRDWTGELSHVMPLNTLWDQFHQTKGGRVPELPDLDEDCTVDYWKNGRLSVDGELLRSLLTISLADGGKKYEQPIRNCLLYSQYARLQEDPAIALSMLVMGIEALIGSGSNPTDRVPARLGVFLEPFREYRKDARDYYRAMYDLRSRAVHGELDKKPVSLLDLKVVRRTVAELLRCLLGILDYGTHETLKELVKEADGCDLTPLVGPHCMRE